MSILLHSQFEPESVLHYSSSSSATDSLCTVAIASPSYLSSSDITYATSTNITNAIPGNITNSASTCITDTVTKNIANIVPGSTTIIANSEIPISLSQDQTKRGDVGRQRGVVQSAFSGLPSLPPSIASSASAISVSISKIFASRISPETTENKLSASSTNCESTVPPQSFQPSSSSSPEESPIGVIESPYYNQTRHSSSINSGSHQQETRISKANARATLSSILLEEIETDENSSEDSDYIDISSSESDTSSTSSDNKSVTTVVSTESCPAAVESLVSEPSDDRIFVDFTDKRLPIRTKEDLFPCVAVEGSSQIQHSTPSNPSEERNFKVSLTTRKRRFSSAFSRSSSVELEEDEKKKECVARRLSEDQLCSIPSNLSPSWENRSVGETAFAERVATTFTVHSASPRLAHGDGREIRRKHRIEKIDIQPTELTAGIFPSFEKSTTPRSLTSAVCFSQQICTADEPSSKWLQNCLLFRIEHW